MDKDTITITLDGSGYSHGSSSVYDLSQYSVSDISEIGRAHV